MGLGTIQDLRWKVTFICQPPPKARREAKEGELLSDLAVNVIDY